MFHSLSILSLKINRQNLRTVGFTGFHSLNILNGDFRQLSDESRECMMSVLSLAPLTASDDYFHADVIQ